MHSFDLKRKNAFLDGKWTAQDSARIYCLNEWGKGYFDADPNGHLVVQPEKNPERRIDLYDVIEGLREREIHTPVLIRFPDIVAHRLRSIRESFLTAIADHDYQGSYCGVYPIKVNQQRHVCEEIRDLGDDLDFGLEAGSKPELLAVLGLTTGRNHMPIVCNGFKDDEYIETVILASKMGRSIIPVVENFNELRLIVKHAQRYDVRPNIGMRVKLSARGAGRWESSAGMRSKFGLFITEMLEALEYLRSCGMADCLKMLHCHVGSQVSNIRQLKNAVNELAHIFTELQRLGAGLDTLNVGGGLGVDYDGSQSAYGSSINYTLDEYAADVVDRIKVACDGADVSHPRIVTECGRAMVAYSSALVFDVLGTSRIDMDPNIERIRSDMEAESEVPQPVVDLLEAWDSLTDRNIQEIYHDSVQARDEALSLFNLGYLSLPMRSATEQLFWGVSRKVLDWATKREALPEEFQRLPELLSDIYFCNFSLFQSIPDSWAIHQVFPVCPIHRLDEEPKRRGILADITCDSDGKVDRFADRKVDKRTLELHEQKPDQRYYLGVFLVGAYQEILGDLHNLFGDTHAVHVSLSEAGAWEIDEVVEGDTVREVLDYVQYNNEAIRRDIRRDLETAVREQRLTVSESKSLLQFYDRGLEGYTYLEQASD